MAPQMPTKVEMAQTESRNLELNPGFSHGWWRSRYMGHSAAFHGTLYQTAGSGLKEGEVTSDILIWNTVIPSSSLIVSDTYFYS